MSSRRQAVPRSATMRLKSDLRRLMDDPVPYITAAPLPSNLLEWHYVVTGPEDSYYQGGYYHGKLLFSPQYPFQPPSIFMITPNGRFSCNSRLCLSISDFHPDTWNPAWSVSTILTGLLSFMLEDTPTVGSIVTTPQQKRQLSRQSLSFNLQDAVFCELFPELVSKIRLQLRIMEEREAERHHIGTVGPVQEGGGNTERGQLAADSGALSNIVIIVGIGLFVYIVKHVVKGLMDEA